MAATTVKILKNNVEVHSERFASPINAAEAKSALTDLNGEWRGRLSFPGSDMILAGGYELTPGSTYHLHMRQQAEQNPSYDIASRLVSDGPSVLPPLDELEDFLKKPLPVKVPMAASALRLLRHLADGFVLDNTGGLLSIAVSAAVCSHDTFGGEPLTAYHVDNVLTRTLFAVDETAPLDQRVNLMLQRDGANSQSEIAEHSVLGPGLMLRKASNGGLIFKGEEKGSGHYLVEAVDVLKKKTACWSEYYYGGADYLLTYAAAGKFFQFFALQRDQTAVEISHVYDLSNPDSRGALVLAAINLYTLLAAFARSLPDYVLPAGKATSIEHDEGFKRTLYFRPDMPSVIKRISAWGTYSKAFHMQANWLTTVYQRTIHKAGLVHAVKRPSFHSANQVELEPLGLRHCIANTAAELQQAAHGLLHGLDALHSAGYVHRDMSWENTSCYIGKQHYFLLDLELAAPADLDPHFHLRSWSPDTLVSEKYKTASDLHMLGRMLQDRAFLATTSEARQFLSSLKRPAEELARDNVTAASLLQHSWLDCAGQDCREAGAQPTRAWTAT